MKIRKLTKFVWVAFYAVTFAAHAVPGEVGGYSSPELEKCGLGLQLMDSIFALRDAGFSKSMVQGVIKSGTEGVETPAKISAMLGIVDSVYDVEFDSDPMKSMAQKMVLKKAVVTKAGLCEVEA